MNVNRDGFSDEGVGHDYPDVVWILPSSGWAAIDLKELWQYWELLLFLAWRDLKVRYKQTVLGVAWAIIQPLFTMVVFTVFFGRFAGMPSDGVPYPVFSYCGLLPWQLFANSLTDSSNSLVASQSLIKKVYFPRLAIPLATICVGLVDFAIAFVVLLLMMWHYGIPPSLAMGALPLFILLAIVCSLGVGIWSSALNVKYRDVRYVMPFLTQVWLLATPVAYPASIVPERWRALYGLNPMVSVVEGFRWILLGSSAPPPLMLAMSVSVVLLVLLSGLFYFRRMEAVFADIV